MKKKLQTSTFVRGLETTGREDGLDLPAWSAFQNTRVRDGAASVRPGFQVVEKISGGLTSCLFDGVSTFGTIPLDTRVHTLGTRWTMEILLKSPSDFATASPIIQGDHATSYGFKVWIDTNGQLNVSLQIAGPTTKTLQSSALSQSTVYDIQITRDDDDCYLSINGGSKTASWTDAAWAGVSGLAPAGDIIIGVNDDDSAYYAGQIEFIRLLDVVWRRDGTTLHGAGDRYGRVRFPDPKARYVLFDYVLEPAEVTNYRFDDRSRYGNHGVFTSYVSSESTLAHQTLPVQLISERPDEDAANRLDVVAGGQYFLGEVGG